MWRGKTEGREILLILEFSPLKDLRLGRRTRNKLIADADVYV